MFNSSTNRRYFSQWQYIGFGSPCLELKDKLNSVKWQAAGIQLLNLVFSNAGRDVLGEKPQRDILLYQTMSKQPFKIMLTDINA